MEQIMSSLTVFFESPFWVGVYQRCTGNRIEAARVVFGAEPKDAEVYAYFLENWGNLRFSPAVKQDKQPEKAVNPKRRQREVNRQLAQMGAGTKAQQALKLMREQVTAERKSTQRERRQQRKQEQFDLRQIKKKEKHKGR